jgi:hypothetical protein
VTSSLPPFPVDDAALDLIWGALGYEESAQRSSITDLCVMFSALAGMDPDAVDEIADGNIRVLRDPQYHHNDIIGALVTEVRRLRTERASFLGGAG